MNRLIVLMLFATACAPREGSYTVAWDYTLNGESSTGSRTIALSKGRQWLQHYPLGGIYAASDAQTTFKPTAQRFDAADYSTQRFAEEEPSMDPAKRVPVAVSLDQLYKIPLVGPVHGAVLVTGMTSDEKANLEVTGVRLTGDANDPVQIDGAFDIHLVGTRVVNGKLNDVKTNGTFTIFASCSEPSTRKAFFCPGTINEQDEQAQYYGTSTVEAPRNEESTFANYPAPCPEGIWSAFVKSDAHFERGSLDAGGKRLVCEGHFCHATTTVEADGCTWEATAIAEVGAALLSNPNATQGWPRVTTFFVSATAPGCSRSQTACQARP